MLEGVRRPAGAMNFQMDLTCCMSSSGSSLRPNTILKLIDRISAVPNIGVSSCGSGAMQPAISFVAALN